ncbi:MAG: hypothetical protein K5765_01155 [Clostridia bacterium]|nr:hypothetical protein [Clostridia bacterium]
MFNDIRDFELEFCLSKEAYKKAYNEDGKLWDENHNTHMEYFHQLFINEDGRQQIIGDIKAINLVFFKSRKEFLDAFKRDEFSNEEYDFLEYFIKK